MIERAALLCYRDGPHVEWTIWDNRELARQAEAELTPCDDQCLGIHSVVGHIDPEADK
jgi:hypothetical protein